MNKGTQVRYNYFMDDLVRLVIQNRKLISITLKVYEYGLVIFSLVMMILTIFQPSLAKITGKIGLELGTVALGWLFLSLLPGLSKRLNLATVVVKILMPFRRELGISMYVSAVGHFLLNWLLPWIILQTRPQLEVMSLTGLSALLVLTPLMLTSNDWAVRTLRRSWGKLHKLVYLAATIIVIHLWFVDHGIKMMALIVLLILELISYTVASINRRKLREGT
jgi:sulfoxide reductase heme-binding subunit YedZ